MTAWFRCICLFVFAGAALSGCASVSYFEQSASGHLNLLAARKNVSKLADDETQPAALRNQMSQAREIRQFAVDALDLPDNKSYKTYVDLGRDYVTVAVFAAPEFSTAPVSFCFPVFGCVPYQAHFSLEAARNQRAELQAKGFDAHLSGVTAYSTLGWTADPLLNTMFSEDETRLPSVVFHELAHQKVYIKNDTPFNEAFAVAVERTGVAKWLESQGKSAAIRDYARDDLRAAQLANLVDKTRGELEKIYQSALPDGQKRLEKTAAIERLRANYKRLRDSKNWQGYRGYDGWFDGEINNAKIAATGVYADLVPDFLKLFDACGGNYPRFYKAVEALGTVAKAGRLKALKRADCG